MQDINWYTRTSDKAETIHEATFITRDKATFSFVIYSTPSSKEPLVCQFRCSISECNKWFVTQPICNTNVCATSGGCYIWIVSLCACAENNKTINVWLFGICTHLLLVSLIKIEHSAFGLMVIFYQLDRKLVCTNSMLHTEPYITFACSAWNIIIACYMYFLQVAWK